MYTKLIVLFISVQYIYSEPNGLCTSLNGRQTRFINRFKSLAVDENNSEEIVVLKPIYSRELPDRSLCGTSLNNNTIESELTANDEFPWVVALLFKIKDTGENADVKCSGTIISRRFVLTSARCVTNKKYDLTHVRLGRWNRISDPDCLDCDPGQTIKVAMKIPHLFYNKLSNNNDIALIRLERDIEFNDAVRSICLPPENLPAPNVKTTLIVSGWGSALDGQAKSEVNMKARVPFISNAECCKILQNIDIQVNQICAGGDPEKNSCQGDSGGPLMRQFQDHVQDRIQWYQEGVLTHSEECSHMGVYTRISRYISWIVSIIDSK